MNWPGGWEMILVFVVILMIFGPKSLPKIGHAIGRTIREFKNASDGITRAIEDEVATAEREEEEARKAKEQAPEKVEESSASLEQHTEQHTE
jgi:sec-independent protein translocase protein TatA